MTPRLFPAFGALLLILAAALPARAAFETQAGAAYVFDLTTGTELLSKNADEPLPPASMSKLMTLELLFEALRDNPNVTMETRFGVSSRAKSMGGSSMFLNENDRPTVEELIQGIIVQSGNDACVVVAEGLAGSEQAFARMMTERAHDLGMENSHFANSSGWPDPGQRMSMYDLGILAAHLIQEFPDYYGYFAEKEFEFDGRVPTNHHNRNPLLGLGLGADGLKTGHTSEAGYGLVGSAAQGDRRIVFVVSGLPSEKARAEESERIVNWAFRQFVERTIAKKGEEVARADVWLGNTQKVGLVLDSDVSLLVPAMKQDGITARAVFDSPLEAPLDQGEKVGELVISLDGLPETRVPLTAATAVGRGGFVPRLKTAAGVLMRRWGVEAAALR